MADLLRAVDLPLGLVTNGEDWLLIYAARDLETASYATWHASLWREEPLTLRALVSLLGARRFFGVPTADRLDALFAESAEHQQDITDQLGAQVLQAVEILIQSIDRLDKERGRALLGGYSVTRLYEAGLTVIGMGFVLEPTDADALLAQDPRHRDCLFPYLNGEDLARPPRSPRPPAAPQPRALRRGGRAGLARAPRREAAGSNVDERCSSR